MKCPDCGGDSRVRSTMKPTEKVPFKRRYRICKKCGFNFVTYEGMIKMDADCSKDIEKAVEMLDTASDILDKYF